MKKIKFFALFLLISLLGITQVKADTIHIQLPIESSLVCASLGIDILIFHKPINFGFTVWNIVDSDFEIIVNGSGDSIIWSPDSIGLYDLSATSATSNYSYNYQINLKSPPLHINFGVYNGGSINSTNDTIWKCTSGGVLVSSSGGLNYPTNTFYTEMFSGMLDSWVWYDSENIPLYNYSEFVTIYNPGVYWIQKNNSCGTTIDTFNVVQLPYTAPILSDTLYSELIYTDTSQTELLTTNYIFCNQTPNITFDAGPGWSTYFWSTGELTQTITPVINTDGVHLYTLTVSNGCGTFNSSASIEVQHFPLPIFPIAIGPYCNDTILTVNPNLNYVYETYIWSTGDTTQFINLNDDISWTCTVTQGGCSTTINGTVIFYEEPLKPEVCVVTVDAGVSKNKIVWTSDDEPDSEDPEYMMIEYYNIYKLINNWTLIGNVLVGDNHVFTDMNSNPLTQSAIYKISAIDGCGNESEKSFYHKTILLSANQGAYPGQIPLNWNHYLDESGSFEVSQYYIYRGPSMSQLSLYDSVPGLMSSYIDTGVYSQTFYQIVVFKDGGCDPSPANLGKGTKSITDGLIMSNVTQIGLGIEENKIDVTIYPNPSNTGIFTIKGENITSIEVYNAIGQQITTITDYNSTLDLSNQSNGIYYAKISTEKGNVVKKLVKQ